MDIDLRLGWDYWNYLPKFVESICNTANTFFAVLK